MLAGLHRPVWAEINLDNLAHNICEVKRIIPAGTQIAAVIKADGYGHGAVEIGQTLLDNGATQLAVATASEAVQLRKHYPEVDILILGYTPNDGFYDVISNNLTPTLFSYEQAKILNDMAHSLGKTQNFHIKIDTGMRRIGFEPTLDSVETIENIYKLDSLKLEGLFTHFAVSDDKDKTFTYEQLDRFQWMITRLEQKDINIPVKHVSNSAAIIDLPDKSYDMVRPGIMLYGFYPSEDVDHTDVKLKEVMTLKAEIAHIKTIPACTGVGYGLTYETKTERKIATLPLGYADGFTRRLSNNAKVVINGNITSIVGRICMDQCMVDVTDLEVKPGDVATIFGPSTNGVSVQNMADDAETIPHEIVCAINKRVPRVYVQNGKRVRLKDWIMMSE